MSQNGSEGLLLVRAEPLRLAQEISRTMVDVARVADGALLLDADPAWARAINTVLVKKGAREASRCTLLSGLLWAAHAAQLAEDRDEEKRADLKFLRVISRTGGGARAA